MMMRSCSCRSMMLVMSTVMSPVGGCHLRLHMCAVGLFATLFLVADAELQVPGLLARQFPFSRVREADINIGLTLSAHQSADGDDRCGIVMPNNMMWSWTMQFAVEQINARNDLLPNVTLGFVHVDDCFNALKALEASVYFVKDGCAGSCNGSVNSLFQSFDVLGVIGPFDSGTSVTIAPYLGTFRIPNMAIYATANALSDKSKYPYFTRLVPPETGQQKMLLEVMRILNWSYVSLVHSADAYGDGAAADAQNLLRLNRDICLAVIVRIPSAATDSDYDDIVDKLAADTQARAVWSYISLVDMPGFFGSVRRRVGIGRFVFIGGDALNSLENEDFADILEGSVYTDLPSAPVSGVQQYVWSLTYGQGQGKVNDEWFGELWQNQFPCAAGAKPTCSPQSLNESQVPLQWLWPRLCRVYDGVYVYAKAIHKAIADNCPEVFKKQSHQSLQLKNCLNGSQMLKYLKNVTMTGTIGAIRFDSNGDLIGAIEVFQYQSRMSDSAFKSYEAVKVGSSANVAHNTSTLNMAMLEWVIFGSTVNSSYGTKPESSCGRSCNIGEYAAQLSITCCWECKPCPGNGDMSTVKDSIKYSRCQAVNEPACGANGELCHNTAAIIGGSVAAGIAVLLTIIIAIVIRSRRAEGKIQQMLWKVDYADICFTNAAVSTLAVTRHDA